MAADKTQLTGPVEIVQTSAEAVAFKLMEKIAFHESNAGMTENQQTREYWLRLYIQCRRATGRGVSAESVLKNE